jgi:hypothetical protein
MATFTQVKSAFNENEWHFTTVQSRRRKLAMGRVRNTRIGHSINKICIARAAAVMSGFH